MQEAEKKAGQLTESFNRASGVIYIGSPPDIELVQSLPEVTAQGLKNALNPPTNAKSRGMIMHDYFVGNVFSPLDDNTPATQAWVDREEKQFQDYIGSAKKSQDAAFDFLTKATQLDKAPESSPFKVGGKYFRYEPKKDVMEKQRFQVSDSEKGPWRTLLDPKTLTPDGSGFLDVSSVKISDDGKRLLYFVSAFGRDDGTLFVMDVATGKLLPDSMDFGMSPDSLMWEEGSSTSFRYAHDYGALKRHTIGQSFAQDYTIASVRGAHVRSLNFGPSDYEWINIRGRGTSPRDDMGVAFWRKGGSAASATVLTQPRTFALKPLIELANGTVLAITTKDAPNGKLISFDPQNPAQENWKTVIPESGDLMLSARLSNDKFLVNYTHDTANALRVYDLQGQHLYDAPVPLQSSIGFLPPTAGEDSRKHPQYVNKTGLFELMVHSFTDPGSTYNYDIEKNEISLKTPSLMKSELKNAIVERLYATSKDGTKIPMTVVRNPDTKLDGTAALKLYGYGAYGIKLDPGYDPSVAQFVNAGGIYVQTNLRGGGEFGMDWYNGGRMANKQNTFDDFIACAEMLIDKDYTQPKRIVIEGGSAGGLLTSATVLQRPDLFGAAIADRPVTDIIFRRSGRPSEYGDPRIREQFNTVAAYSPVQNVKHGAKYPPILIVTGDNDDRVETGQPFRLAATLQAESDPNNVVLLHVEKGASHTTSKDPVKGMAEKFAFIEKALGPINQDEYKAKLAVDAQVAAKAAARSAAAKKAAATRAANKNNLAAVPKAA